ncbi:MAG TPA: EF-hand domain-containing protein [Acidobacteriota bacterium]|nr:EF-hand domain-containing protein [Acidobacteriota bacterium]
MARFVTIAVSLLSLALSSCFLSKGQRFHHFTVETPVPKASVLVLGFMGGRTSWDDEREGVRKLALRLRQKELPLAVETVENKKRKLALQLIIQAFDKDGDGRLDREEKDAVRLVLYGQSFGGAAVVKLARQLHRRDIPVLLTVQVDSVGRGDAKIPPNVQAAANLYQDNGWFIEGEKPIVAEDPDRTRILGNFRFDYKDRDIDLSGVPWHKLIFRKAHAKMNLDPEVWNKVEELILDACQAGLSEPSRDQGDKR